MLKIAILLENPHRFGWAYALVSGKPNGLVWKMFNVITHERMLLGKMLIIKAISDHRDGF